MIFLKNIALKRIFHYLNYDKPRAALNIINIYIKIFTIDSSIALAMGYTFSQLGLEEQYNEQLKIIKKIYKDTFYYSSLISLHHSRNKRYLEAIEQADISIHIAPDESVLYNNRGFFKSKINLYEDSIIDFNKALELDPNNYLAYNNRGFSKIKLKDSSGIIDIKKSLAGYSNNAVAYKNLALWEIENGNKNKALRLLNKAESKKFYHQATDEIEILRTLCEE